MLASTKVRILKIIIESYYYYFHHLQHLKCPKEKNIVLGMMFNKQTKCPFK